jgi:hypothetical protein
MAPIDRKAGEVATPPQRPGSAVTVDEHVDVEGEQVI